MSKSDSKLILTLSTTDGTVRLRISEQEILATVSQMEYAKANAKLALRCMLSALVAEPKTP